MNTYEKIKFMRVFKGWSQEQMAEKLGLTVSGYAKIERGLTDITISRLENIARIFEIELSYLLELSEKNVFNLVGNSNHHNNINCFTAETEILELEHEIDKYHLIVEQKDNEITFLRNEIAHLNQIIELIKGNGGQRERE